MKTVLQRSIVSNIDSFKENIDHHTNACLDDKERGIVYAKVFFHCMVDEEPIVAKSLNGTQVDFNTIKKWTQKYEPDY